jgi:hypothetical protein
MSNTSLPPYAPMTNGVHTTRVNGEADVSSYAHHDYPADAGAEGSPPRTLKDVCAVLHGQVTQFLDMKANDDVTRRTQEQTRIALEVIAKALRDYEYVFDFRQWAVAYM